MKTIGQRIKHLRTQKGYSQQRLAELCGWESQSRIGNYETDRREPSVEDARQLGKVLGIHPSFLMFGDVPPPTSPDGNLPEGKSVGYPLITWVRAGRWDKDQSWTDEFKTLYTTRQIGPKGFWLKVIGDSMASATGVSFPSGSHILVDPDGQLTADCFVIAKRLASGEAAFRRYVEDSGTRYLRPLNPNYPEQFEQFDGNYSITGVIVEAMLDSGIKTSKEL